MFGLLLSDESWLNATNAFLGIVAGIALIAIGSAVFHDILVNIRKRARERQHFVFNPHALHVPELGLTMADGGEPVNGDQPESKN
jgi:hypothetical protein